MGEAPLKNVPIEEATRFIARVGTEAREYGASAPRVGDFLRRLAKSLGLHEAFLAWPEHMLFIVEDREHRRQHMEVEQLRQTGVSLGKLADVGEVVDAVVAGDQSLDQGLQSLDDIASSPLPWPRATVAISYAAIGLGLAVLLRGSWADVALGSVLALIVYGIVVGVSHLGSRSADWLPALTAFVPAAIATTVRHWHPGIDIFVVTIAAVAVLLPGYAVSVGIGELVEDHVIAGWSNLLRGLVYLSKQVLGAWLGYAAVRAVLDPPEAPADAPVPEAWLWLVMPVLIAGLCVVFQTSRRDFLWAVISCGLAYGVAVLAESVWSENLGTVLAAAAATVYANLWAGRSRRPTSIVLLPAIVILVSGSIRSATVLLCRSAPQV
jgi:uncharacterized membrane protein YjjP (DUF1212 family)